MSWISLAILAYFLWAMSNIIDKIVVTKYVKDYFCLSLMSILFGSFFILIYSIIVSGINPINLTILVIALLAGFTRVLAYCFYYKAMSYEEASRVTILTQLAPIFTLLFSVLLIKEVLNFNGYLAFILLLISGILSSTKFDVKKIKISLAFWDMILFAITVSASAVMMKYIFGQANFWQCMIWIVIGEIITSIIISILFKKSLFKIFNLTALKGKILVIFNEILSSSALIIYSLALTLGSVTLIGALSTSNPIFVFLMALLMSIFVPKILKEEIDKNTIILKIFAIIIMGAGIYLL
ncbi:MAG: putative membrane protein, DUF6 family [uncultured bacterium]|nr:MAG: putative membrane protein, DUF6 family [uncultured bacterium]